MRKFILTLAVAVLAACSTTPASDEAAVEATLTAAEQIGDAYVSLPVCVTGGPTLCKTPSVVTQLVQYDNAAYAAVVQARTAIANPASTSSAVTDAIAAAQVAVTAYNAYVSQQKVQ